ncbi:gas vesicle accessory protein GvpU [Psychrobacillus sp. NPDC093180]|uniref:gas vesicle accessory protein GvpU n=1 Tax=Psychrobacillus sp. NPDC093180 TaxID=3364489 RepID=UPI003823B9AE
MENEKNSNQDVLLTSLIAATNNSTLEIGVTLNVNGNLITGLLISYESYLKATSERLKGHNKMADVISGFFDKIAKEHAAYKESSGGAPSPSMIHLKDAKLIDGNNTFNLEYWRGKISSVDGFIIGNYQTN